MTAVSAEPLQRPAFFLSATLCDLDNAGLGGANASLARILDQLRGEVGVTGLAVWGATAQQRYFRVREAVPRLIRCEGGLLFETSLRRGKCRPPAGTMGAKSALPAVATACARHDLALRLLLSTASMGGLAQYYPEFATRSAFDDASQLSVCLLNPAVQECIAGIACEIPLQFGVRQIVLHDFQVGWFEASDCGIRWPSPLGDVERSMLGTCFCPSCAKAAEEAGVDAEAARRSVQNLVQRSLAQATSFGGTQAGFLAEQTALAAFRTAQREQLNAFLRKIVEDSRTEVLVARSGAEATLEAAPWDARIPAGVITDLTTLTQLPNSILPQARRNEVALPAATLLGSRAEEFIAAMSRLGEWGYAGVQIDDYSALPDSAWVTLKQAIRFARRSATM